MRDTSCSLDAKVKCGRGVIMYPLVEETEAWQRGTKEHPRYPNSVADHQTRSENS